MTISRRNLLTSSAGLGLLGLLPKSALAAPNFKRIAVVRAFGGWDVTYCMDPKFTIAGTVDGPDGDINGGDETIETFNGIPIMINDNKRPSVSQFFQAYSGETIVVNGIYTGSIVHGDCQKRILTGDRSGSFPDMGAIAAVQQTGDYILPYLDLTGGALVGEYAAQTGQLGKNNQILALLDRELRVNHPDGMQYPIYTPPLNQKVHIENYLEYRRNKLQSTPFGGARSAKQVADLSESQERKIALQINRDLLLDNLQFGSSGTLTSQAQTAALLMRENLCHSVSLQTTNSWDTHDDISDQHALFEDLFSGLNTLVAELQNNGLFSETLIVVLSEMTRTPRKNADGGKDHWSSTSAMVIGGGINGGQVLGGTTDRIDTLGINLNNGQIDEGENPLSYDQFVAGILHAMGTEDTTQWLPNVEVLHGIID